jgi:hypothetical protein
MTAKRRQSLVAERESTTEGRVAMAGARAAVQTVTLLNQALETSGRNQSELAALLGVTGGRVSQVVNGDGNLRVSTIARFLRAAGYRLKLTAEPADAGVAPLAQPAPRRPSSRPAAPRFAAVYTATSVTGEGVGPEPIIQLSASHPSRILDRSMTCSLVVDMETGVVERSSVQSPARDRSPSASAPAGQTSVPQPVHHG